MIKMAKGEVQDAGMLASLTIKRLVTDSRAVLPGDTFVAYPGEKSDGRQFIAQAIAQGANGVIYEETLSGHAREERNFEWDPQWNVPNMAVQDLRHKAGELADAVYGTPSEKLWMVGVTGTNGKTSCSHWIAQALNDCGKKCALIGTLGNGFAGALQATANTTPDAISVHGLLADYLSVGAQSVAMEVSSHALAQGRVNGVRFDVALLTNLTRDHLDYHGDMESYATAKRRLFDWKALKYAVVNLDDAFGAELASQLRDQEVEIIGYGLTEAALQLAERYGMRMVYGHLQQMNLQGLQLALRSSWGAAELHSGLLGRFNAANLLGALAVLLVSDVSLEDGVRTLGAVQSVAGRMQGMSGAGQPAVIVDYAHTPDALEKVLLALREISMGKGETSGRLICVFGCGGDRDKGKRAMMGRVAEKFSDVCIVTSDNPRSEDPRRIIAEVVSAMEAGKHEIIVERAAAIERAVLLAQSGDTVLLAGKGHEAYQEINGVKQPFSDVTMAIQALKKWSARQSGGVQ
ncbi:MAG: UDP-N-acetylmuramoyl-L-alanyl-D-glutamate--2,6-diaminopimelate ligase [Gallionella sp.]|nr:UDP-N-acetylmuramoyl-L-alanyl-D-glutamate--2,6-diaminopimelate ligase [Gallionella sp.]